MMLSAAHWTAPGHHRCRTRHPARLQHREVANELSCAVFPRALEREFAAGLARHGERAQAGAAQVLVERADWMIGDDVERTSDREGCDRRAAGQGLKLYHAEGIGEAREHEDVSGSH